VAVSQKSWQRVVSDLLLLSEGTLGFERGRQQFVVAAVVDTSLGEDEQMRCNTSMRRKT